MAKGLGEAGGLPKSTLNRPGPVAVKGAALPTRPRVENSKPAVELRANYFGLTFTVESLTAWKYTFKVLGSNNKELSGANGRDVFKSALGRLEARPDEYATDFQHQIVSLKRLKIPENENKRLAVKEFEGCAIQFENSVQVQLGTSALASPSPDVIDCLNLIVGQGAREQSKIVTFGRRHRFFRGSEKADVPELMSVIREFFQSVHQAENTVLLNANPTIPDFRPAGYIEEIYRLLKDEAATSDDALAVLHEAISKAKVSYNLPDNQKTQNNRRAASRIGRIVGLARKDDKDSRSKDLAHPLRIDKDFPRSTEVRFWVQNEYRTVFGHFEKEWGLKLSKTLPLINMGKPGRPEYVPAEYCRVLDIPSLAPRKLDQLSRFTCQLPESKQVWIQSAHKPQGLNLDPGTNRVLSKFRVAVHQKELLKVTGRKLDSPLISYCDNKPASVPPEASWKFAERSLAKGPSIKTSWTWIYLGGDVQNDLPRAEDGVKQLDDILKKMCAKGSPPRLVNMNHDRISKNVAAIRASLARAAQNSDIKLVVVISPSTLSADIYNALKFFGDIQTGIHTSCILLSKLGKIRKDGQPTWNYGYFRNVALKINLKLGGTSHRLEQELDPAKKDALMVVAYGASHQIEDDKNAAKKGGNTVGDVKAAAGGSKQSLARDKSPKDITSKRNAVGLVVSADEKLGQWLSSYWNQERGQEMMGMSFTENLETLLRTWKSANAIALSKPTISVVIYRDGVSESQFDRVLQQEVPMIRQAFKKVFDAKPFRITLVVTIKRHATRFFPVEAKDGDLNRSIRPGTVVDNVVARPSYREFFLASHFAPQGNTRPTRYVALLDEVFQEGGAGDPADPAGQLEKFTHDLSYLFGRATTAVSVCTPAYYADILCARAHAYAAALAQPETRSEIEKSIAGEPGKEKERVLAGEIHPLLERSMHWI